MTPIRHATPEDADAVTTLVRTAFAIYVPRLGGVEPWPMRLDYAGIIADGQTWVAEEGGEVVGVVGRGGEREERGLEAGRRDLEVGDAEALPYDDESFDLVMTMFGAMFAPRPEVTAAELVRVTKPGGLVAVKDLDVTLYQFLPLDTAVITAAIERAETPA